MVIKITEPKRFSKIILIRKLIAVGIFIWLYYNLIFWFIFPEIFTNPISLSVLIILYIVGTVDIMIRPLPEKVKVTNVEKAIAVMGLLQPFLLILAYLENKNIITPFIPFWNELIVAYIGMILMVIGGIIMLISRIQLGKYGTPVVHTGETHKLVTKGLYKVVRHPMYFGAILIMLGPYIAIRSLIVLIASVISYVPLMRARIKIEEDTLIGAFGDDYRNYMRRTKKLIPLIY